MRKTIDYTAVEAGEFDAFRQIVAELRGEHGCPWDREQTFESLKPCMVNEMTEALAGIDLFQVSGNAENLCEELGDVLLQVVLLAQIAKEEGLFAVEDVIRGVSHKMIRRHPHVFGDDQRAFQKQEILGRWEGIKRAERRNKAPEAERQEKEAFREAAKWVVSMLEKDDA